MIQKDNRRVSMTSRLLKYNICGGGIVRFSKESGAELDLGVFWLVKMGGQRAFQGERRA